MAKQSKFKDSEVNAILNEMVEVLERHHAGTDLSLVVLGNMTTHLLTKTVGKSQGIALAEAFSHALLNSVKNR